MLEKQVLCLVVMLMAIAPTALAVDAASAAVGSTKSAKAAASHDGWPDTREGAVGRAWTEAFSSGDSSMGAFIAKYVTPASLKTKGVEARMATYRENRERFGSLTLASVVKSSPGELVVSLLAADATAHEFTFKLETKPPYQLVSISRAELRSQSHGFGFHH